MNESDDLPATLERAIEEMAASARLATPGPWRYQRPELLLAPGTTFLVEAVLAGHPWKEEICVADTSHMDFPQSMANAAHIAAHDPHKILRQCEFDQQIVQLHANQHWCIGYGPRAWSRPYHGCDTLRLMAYSYGIEGFPVNVDEHGDLIGEAP